jgi:hypothetical protein
LIAAAGRRARIQCGKPMGGGENRRRTA